MRTVLMKSTLLVVIAACGEPQALLEGARPSQAPRPLGAADGAGDRADQSCLVVLRSVGRIKSGPGYATTCDLGTAVGGQCRYVWEGQVEVDAQQVGSLDGVEVLYRTSQTGGQWYAVKAQAEAGGTSGFARYRFVIDEHTPAPGMSMTSLNKTVIELIPYVTTPLGGRTFDHNRVSDPFGSYRLELANMWQVQDDPATCPGPAGPIPQYVLDYPAFNETLVGGPALAGGQLRVRYDGRRLRETQTCMGAKGPVSATTIHLGYMFDHDGSAVQTAQVEQYVESYGYACQGTTPCVTQTKDEPVISLPAGARSIQLWFYCVPGFSSGSPGNWKYDSNLGQDYELPLVGAKGVDWAGGWRLHAARSGYTFPLADPHEYSGFTNMGFSAQAEVYIQGLTDQPTLDSSQVKAYVESDLMQCTPGGALQKVELPAAASRVGPFGNNALYRWGFEGIINNCPKGSYRYRFLFSADGGKTVTPLGAAPSTADPGAAAFRTLIFK